MTGQSDLGHMNNLKELSKCVSLVFCTADLDQRCAKHWRVCTLDRHCRLLRAVMCSLPLDISQRCWKIMLMKVLCDLPGQTKSHNAVISLRGKELCLLTFSSEVVT